MPTGGSLILTEVSAPYDRGELKVKGSRDLTDCPDKVLINRKQEEEEKPTRYPDFSHRFKELAY